MNLSLVALRLPEEDDGLVSFLTSNSFPFHVGRTPSMDEARRRIESGSFADDEHQTFWLVDQELGRIGFIRLEDLADDTPMFDLRLADEHRGRGLGVLALRAAADHIFTTLEVNRFEGCTRADNLPMRRTFEKAGWVQEAHFRQAWPVQGEPPADAVNYSILRQDWESGSRTPTAPLGGNGVHHIELWTHDLAGTEASFGWLMTALGWPLVEQDWEQGRSWQHPSGAYLVLEQSPALTGQRHDRLQPGLNHLAFTVTSRDALDALRRDAPAHGWRELFEDRYPTAGGHEVQRATCTRTPAATNSSNSSGGASEVVTRSSRSSMTPKRKVEVRVSLFPVAARTTRDEAAMIARLIWASSWVVTVSP
ncbi:RimJ/RimL family protein N-acetyltransferase [Luteococcus japonicus]|uniref:RimJ/RimL family protein N-acetyltransferase n=1 Tax=Luteococcus japonicus TaxID=33984 RepID=A0A3N1ZXU6_9ACTN|nr:RimJ/RimL family protein N-acetyltransferase [Luteococcus japonicus]